MAINDDTNREDYAGTGALTQFAVPFVYFDDDDVRVIHVDSSGTETVWVKGTQYTLSGDGSAGTGQVDVETSPTDYTPASGETLVVRLYPALEQSITLPKGNYLDDIERGLDFLLQIILRQNDEISRSLKFAEGSSSSDITFPELEADKILGVNSAGTALAFLTPNSDAYLSVSAFILTLLDDATAAAARTTLGAGTLDDVVSDTTPQLGGVLDTNGQAINFSEGSAVASATSPDIWATDGNTVHITGTTTITDFADAPRIGAWRWLVFDGALTFTHGSGITLPGSANITTAAGDIAFVYADAVDAFRVVYFPVSGEAVVSTSTDVQTFTSSGTWNKPSSGTIAIVELWGGGGSGGTGTGSDGGGGGGGGAYKTATFDLADLGSSETVTIGAGGAGQTTGSSAGNQGGNSTFGSHLTAYGGGPGADEAGQGGGGGGGYNSAGTNGGGGSGGTGGGPSGGSGGSTSAGGDSIFGGGGGGDLEQNGGDSVYGGGGGAGGGNGGSGVTGGDSIYGGGGGGSPGQAGGTSVIGGAGSAGQTGATDSDPGAQPGGGSGGTVTGDSGAGGDGYCRVTVI